MSYSSIRFKVVPITLNPRNIIVFGDAMPGLNLAGRPPNITQCLDKLVVGLWFFVYPSVG